MNTVQNDTTLTEKQQAVLDFIRECQQVGGMTPSQAEICDHFGFASKTAVVGHLNALEKKGMIKRDGNKTRSLVLNDGSVGRNLIRFPIYGSIAAGMPTDQTQESMGCVSVDTETLRLPRGARVFALQVRGDSMINAGILQGDTVLLEFRESKNNDIVAALIDGETTLKRLLVKGGRPYLKAENPKYRDLIPASELVIQGVMVGLLRLIPR